MLSSLAQPKILALLVLFAGTTLFTWNMLKPTGGGTKVSVSVPELSEAGAQGKQLFDGNCAKCHGTNASGTDHGPPLVHRIYEPNHHGDMSFQLAVRNGVRAHHWRYGNMAPVSGVTDEDVGKITRYVRELQKANGVF